MADKISLTIPKFQLPKLISTIGCKLPQWPHSLALIAGLNTVVKLRLLPADSLELLEGKIFLIEVLDTGGRASFTFRARTLPPDFRPARHA